jgi:hypothetical protein
MYSTPTAPEQIRGEYSEGTDEEKNECGIYWLVLQEDLTKAHNESKGQERCKPKIEFPK